MDKRLWATIFIGAGIVSWLFPSLNLTSGMTSGDVKIIASIFIVGGVLIWYLPDVG